MPQMSPLMWLILMSINIFLIYIAASMIFYSQPKIAVKFIPSFKLNSKKWKFSY